MLKAVSDLDRKKIDQLEEQILNLQHENSKLKVCSAHQAKLITNSCSKVNFE